MTQEQSRSGTWSALGAVLSALAASICCVGPLVLLALGAGGAWASRLSVLEPYRPVFIAITIGFLGFAFYRAYRMPEGAACAPDGSCAVPRARRISRIVLWIVTPLILALLAFPYFAPRLFAATSPKGATDMQTNQAGLKTDACCLPNAQPAAIAAKDMNMTRKNTNPNLISLFSVPSLVCTAAPQIGSGPRAKPILLNLQRESGISEAWLNNAGTVLAVVGMDGSTRESRAKAVQAALQANGEPTATELAGDAREQQLMSFASGDGWHRGAEVDTLSKQEAATIAARLVHRVQAQVSLPDDNAKALQQGFVDAFNRTVASKPDKPQERLPQYNEELLKVAQANLDEKGVEAFKEALAKGIWPVADEK
jgi:mercuric ion transport protein